MNHKYSMIPLALIVLVGAVWAASMITPDKPGFPSLPNSAGTLGHVLEPGVYFLADGTAKNGNALGGTGANVYLKNMVCTDPLAVWKGIDGSGNPLCKGPPLAFAQIYAGTLQVNGVVMPVGTILKEGDKIETNATQTGTIRFTHNPQVAPGFTPGDSIARLGNNTTVLLDRGDTAGTLALVTLEDGLLWGRVLSSTGIDFGGGGLIAGVRGTSLSLKNPTLENYTLTIPHSQRGGEAAVLRTNFVSQYISPDGDNTATEAVTLRGVLTQTAYNPDILRYNFPASTPIINRTALYTADAWIRDNTLLDIAYMRGLPQTPMIVGEIAATLPSTDTEKYGLCTSNDGYLYGTGQYGCASAYADESTNWDLKWNSNTSTNWEALTVRDLSGTTDWDSFKDGNNIGNHSENPFAPTQFRYSNLYEGVLGANDDNKNKWYNQSCNGIGTNTVRNTVGTAYCRLVLKHYETSPRTATGNLYEGVWVQKRNDTNYNTNISRWELSIGYSMIRFISGYRLHGIPDYSLNPETLNITQPGQYLTYVGNQSQLQRYLTGGTLASGFSYSQLAGKTITIEFEGSLPDGYNGINSLGNTILDLGDNLRILRSSAGNWNCTSGAIVTSSCTSSNSTPFLVIPNGNTVSIRINTGTPISRFIVGNSQQSGYIQPVNRRINKIIISN